MRVRVLSVAVGVLAFVSLFGVGAVGQVSERVAGTWGGAGSSFSILRGVSEGGRRGGGGVGASARRAFSRGGFGGGRALARALGCSAQERGRALEENAP